MCGRISTSSLSPDSLKALFGLDYISPFKPKYNVAPTFQIPAIRERDQNRYLESLRWGLIPHWAKDKSIGNRMINARIETLAEKPSFKKPLQHQRCIIPVSGFYEWKAEGKSKQPYYIHRADEMPLTFAGLWEHWVNKESGEIVESCTIITTKANTQLEVIHNRMPVVLDYEQAKEWLVADMVEPELLKEILEHPGTVDLDLYPVSDYVNSVKYEGEKCIERVAEKRE